MKQYSAAQPHLPSRPGLRKTLGQPAWVHCAAVSAGHSLAQLCCRWSFPTLVSHFLAPNPSDLYLHSALAIHSSPGLGPHNPYIPPPALPQSPILLAPSSLHSQAFQRLPELHFIQAHKPLPVHCSPSRVSPLSSTLFITTFTFVFHLVILMSNQS